MARSPSDKRPSRAANARELLVRGKAAAKAGDTEEADFYLRWALRAATDDDQRIEAWFWLSEIAENPAEKRQFLSEVLARNPAHPRARRRLAILDGRLQVEDVVDPDRLEPVPEGEPQDAAVRRFQCPHCSARMVFTPDGEGLYCEHCGHGTQTQQTQATEDEQDFIVTMATARGHRKPVGMLAFSCHSCAASFLLAPQSLSVTCPYCEATYAVEEKETRELVPPQGIIPFAIAEDQARRLLARWLDEQHISGRVPMNGLYLPVWTFDVGGFVDWRAESQEYDSFSRNWLPVSGRYPILYDDYLVPACKTLSPRLARVLNGFDLHHLLAFEDSYLAAWPAQTYEIPVGDASLVARQAVLKLKRSNVIDHIQQRQEVRNVRLSSAGMLVESYKLILLPVWIAHFRRDQQQGTLVVNGQTGKFLAEDPGRMRDQGPTSWFRKLFG